MDKMVITAIIKKPSEFEFSGKDIKVLSYISPVNEAVWIDRYIETCFKDSDFSNHYLEAEWELILEIINELTNIRIIEETDNITLEELITSGLWDKIRSTIINYNDFRKDLETIVEYQKEQNNLEKSVGAVLGNISDKVIQLIDKIMEIDISQEGISKLLDNFRTEVSKFDNTFGNTPSQRSRKTSNKN